MLWETLAAYTVRLGVSYERSAEKEIVVDTETARERSSAARRTRHVGSADRYARGQGACAERLEHAAWSRGAGAN